MLRYLFALLVLIHLQSKTSAAVVLKGSPSPLMGAKIIIAEHPPAAGLKSDLVFPKKFSILKKMELKFIQKKLKNNLAPFYKDKEKSKKTLSTLSLILGIASIILMFVPVAQILILLTAPAAIITGIIALKDNADKGLKTKAIIGIVGGSIPLLILIFLFAYLVISGFSFSF